MKDLVKLILLSTLSVGALIALFQAQGDGEATSAPAEVVLAPAVTVTPPAPQADTALVVEPPEAAEPPAPVAVADVEPVIVAPEAVDVGAASATGPVEPTVVDPVSEPTVTAALVEPEPATAPPVVPAVKAPAVVNEPPASASVAEASIKPRATKPRPAQPTPLDALSFGAGDGMTVISVASANLRQAASKQSAVVATLTANTVVQVLWREPNGWVHVQSGSASGFVHQSLLNSGASQ